MKFLYGGLFLCMLSFSMPSLAEVHSYELLKEKSTLKFYAIKNNEPVTGRFNNFTADIRFDPEDLQKSSIIVEVDMGSVEASYDEVTINLKLPEWLSTVAFPRARFVSDEIFRMPMTDNYYAEGELTLRDKTMPITINFRLNDSKASKVIAKGFATIRRRDFAVGQGKWDDNSVIKDDVRVEFRIVAEKQ